jgi:hypothetical protein
MVAVKIEGMMNDRPLYQPLADPEDLPVTPSMLMHGCQLGQLLIKEGEEESGTAAEKMNRLWRRALLYATWQTFFAIYVRETLPKFCTWMEETKDRLKVGQIVLLSTEKLARALAARAGDSNKKGQEDQRSNHLHSDHEVGRWYRIYLANPTTCAT